MIRGAGRLTRMDERAAFSTPGGDAVRDGRHLMVQHVGYGQGWMLSGNLIDIETDLTVFGEWLAEEHGGKIGLP